MLLWKQEIPWVFDEERRKKKEDGKNVFFKALAKTFFVNIKKLFMGDLLINGLDEKAMMCHIIMLYYWK